MTLVSSFLYRLPRFHIHFPVEFECEQTLTAGQCENLSDTGLLARFLYPLGTDSTGTLHLRPANRLFAVRATVSHSEGFQAGLRFQFADDQQRQVIRALVEIVSTQGPAPP